MNCTIEVYAVVYIFNIRWNTKDKLLNEREKDGSMALYNHRDLQDELLLYVDVAIFSFILPFELVKKHYGNILTVDKFKWMRYWAHTGCCKTPRFLRGLDDYIA